MESGELAALVFLAKLSVTITYFSITSMDNCRYSMVFGQLFHLFV